MSGEKNAPPSRRWSDEELSRILPELQHFLNVTFPQHSAEEGRWRDSVEGAFPRDKQGRPDFHGHCTAHEAIIAAKNAEEAFYLTAKQELLKGGVRGFWLLVALIGGLALYGLRAKLAILVGIPTPPP